MNKLKILIIGSGGREHAIGWKVVQSSRAGEMFFAPGNAGTANFGTNVNIKATDIEGLLAFAKKENIDLTLALPDDPLALGVVDLFKENGLKIFGPTQKAAMLESSKAFAKRFMQKYNLPTAEFKTFTEYDKAIKYLSTQKIPIVVKVSGLALGKGVFICESLKEAELAVKSILVDKAFGEAGSEIVIEEYMTGPEVSTHAFSDGENYSMFPTAQDHKRVGEGDTGPNTGGMGTIAPLPFVGEEIIKNIKETIISPAIKSMSQEGAPFVGVLYPGLMLTKDGSKILEFNARFGDPETQTYMRLLDSDIVEIFLACIEGKLSSIKIEWKKESACTIVLASGGYPGNYEKGKVIEGIGDAELDPDIVIFHAGTAGKDGEVVTNGGRVLGVSATCETLEKALEKAYKAVTKISFEGMQYRRDIGKKALDLQK